ncbi:LytR/AlgR family response regulator transcription factor [Parapedobacter sp. 2B3]|uniref:LytR/AlgR family response regulator transcription factor n=1 Tax=Parapedobacter sp. 2B3 TaxID=3342381 RepID=UPI0035B5EA61
MTPSAKIEAFVIDDEPPVLADVVEELTSSGLFEVVGMFGGLPAALQAAGELGPPDFVLCDIHLNGLSGLHVTSLFADSFVVFMTGHPEYSEDAFRAYPEGCVYKPVLIDDLMPLVAKFHKRHPGRPMEIIGGNLMIYSTPHNDIRPIPVDAILYAEASQGYVSIFTAETEWITDISLTSLAAKLVRTKRFMRLSAKHLVAYSAITHINKPVVYVGEKALKVTQLGKEAFEHYMRAVWGGRDKKDWLGKDTTIDRESE